MRKITNLGWFKKGQVSLNRGRTIESWVGEKRAKEIRLRMSLNSKRKAEFLRKLNRNQDFLKKRVESRRFHEQVVLGIAQSLRTKGFRCYVLSEYVKEVRTPDAMLYDGHQLVALEVEQDRRYKASHEAMLERLQSLNARARFFDKTSVVFVPQGEDLDKVVRRSVRLLLSKD